MILYDLKASQPYSNAKYHGGGKFALIILSRMLERGVRFSCFYDSSLYVDPIILKTLTVNGIQLFDLKQESFDRIADSIPNVLVFSIQPAPYMFKYPTIGTIHDIRGVDDTEDWDSLHYKEGYRTKLRFLWHKLCPQKSMAKSANSARSLILSDNFIPTTITLFSKFAIYNALKDEKVLLMPVFMTPSVYTSDKSSLASNKKYILILSANRSLKNARRAIRAIDRMLVEQQFSEYKVIVTGASSSKDISYRCKNKNRFQFTGYVNETDLEKLYADCSILVFPSLYEGFGMPVQEAMAYGKPVVCSSLSALPEVYGDNVVYINPYSEFDIAAKTRMLLVDKDLYKYFSQKSRECFSTLLLRQQKDVDAYIDFVLNKDAQIKE